MIWSKIESFLATIEKQRMSYTVFHKTNMMYTGLNNLSIDLCLFHLVIVNQKANIFITLTVLVHCVWKSKLSTTKFTLSVIEQFTKYYIYNGHSVHPKIILWYCIYELSRENQASFRKVCTWEILSGEKETRISNFLAWLHTVQLSFYVTCSSVKI